MLLEPRVLSLHQREIARFVHVQMQDHFWENAIELEVIVSQGVTELKASAYSTSDPTRDFRQSPADKSKMAKYLFAGFSRCLYRVPARERPLGDVRRQAVALRAHPARCHCGE